MSRGSDDLSDSFPDWLRDKELKRAQKKEKAQREKRFSSLRRSPLNKVSKKQKKRNQEYHQALDRHYEKESNKTCAICGSSNNLSIHHKEGRGSKVASEETFVTLCILGTRFNELYPDLNPNNGLGCHQGVEANKGWARENGFLVWSKCKMAKKNLRWAALFDDHNELEDS